MKKIYFIAVITVAMVACGMYKTLDLRKLTTGMTKVQVEKLAGAPSRTLSVKETTDGFQEVLEYRTSRDEVYALEFWNDYLVGYEYLYDDITYVAPLYPPQVYPPFGRPIYRPSENRPGRPGQSNRPERPNNPATPGRPERPENPGSTRPPATERPTTRPTEGSRPVGTVPENNSSTARDRTREQNTNTQSSPERSRRSE